MKTSTMQNRLARAERKVEVLEQLLEQQARSRADQLLAVQGVRDSLAATIAAVPGSLLQIDALGTITRASVSARELLVRGGPIVGSTVAMISARVAAIARGEGTEPQFEDQWRTEDGEEVPVLVNVAWAPQGDLVCIGVDLRERRRLEVELQFAQKMDALGQLASGIAHEINTPLQFVSDNLDFVEEVYGDFDSMFEAYGNFVRRARERFPAEVAALEEKNEELDIAFARENGAGAAARARAGLQRMRRIVRAIRGVSNRRDAWSEVELDTIVDDAVVVARSVTKHVASVETHYDGGRLNGSSSDLGQLVINLLVNASHAISDAGRAHGTIEVRTAVEDTLVRLSVRDDGCGMAPEIQRRVFEPFFTTKPVGEGTGQGLALVSSIVQRHGGTIDVQSKPGQGATFIVTLPRNHQPETLEAAQ